MTILSVIKDVSTVIGLTVPTAVFSSTDREHVELQSLANEMAHRIAFDTRDWTKLKTLATLTGDGVSQGFDLPDDYQRMLKKARIWPSASPYAPYSHYADSDQWLGLAVQNFANLVGAWTMIGEQILIKPPVANLTTAQFYYITNLIIKDNAGAPKAAFTADDDVYRLDERVLKLGMIWQWKANKGQAYSEDMATYEDALSVSAGADKGSNIIVIGQGRQPVDADFAFPGVITP
ncbi:MULTISPECIES: hypothetical protein [unclassified Mesorhizobium]|uniref:phage adaptor protein n=1 Tax=unclassified Mesorhizobium TaxID=325217 RepID=UPI000FCBB13F|nr:MULTISPECIES: hypothetical protein [unclassified Mesorhizobium]RUX96149.1 hypothetical protein EN993_08900 [Mesorhizobium sp. M7D.F.Ca.US.004.01.2.1]RVA22829.1 hypothetical protein EN935_29195 [Mesorhizobium sp. M7D.F.Ca.US.004.03.1.1]